MLFHKPNRPWLNVSNGEWIKPSDFLLTSNEQYYVLHTLYTLSHLILTVIQWHRIVYYLHFTGKKLQIILLKPQLVSNRGRLDVHNLMLNLMVSHTVPYLLGHIRANNSMRILTVETHWRDLCDNVFLTWPGNKAFHMTSLHYYKTFFKVLETHVQKMCKTKNSLYISMIQI